LPFAIEEAAFRIIQESLNNVVKHAQAARVQVELDFGPSVLRVVTRDNGVGFDPGVAPRADALGMASMRERAEAVGGRFSVETAPGRGTRVLAELPVHDVD
jgi:signal transduction histidine kinase